MIPILAAAQEPTVLATIRHRIVPGNDRNVIIAAASNRLLPGIMTPYQAGRNVTPGLAKRNGAPGASVATFERIEASLA